MIEARVAGLQYDNNAKSHVVFLSEVDGERVLPIWIGPAEASAIGMEMLGKKFQRPLTHDLALRLVERLSGKLERVVIDAYSEEGSRATLHLSGPSGVQRLEAGAGDGVALALRADLPVFVTEEVLARAGGSGDSL